jgi:Flp pilus assembly protein TadG
VTAARRLGRLFRKDRRGIAAIEFAIGAPMMLILLLMGVDTSRYLMATKRIDSVAATIGQMISVNQNGSVTDMDLQFYRDSAMVIFPQVLSDSYAQNISWTSDIGITMTGVSFTKQGSVYVPKVIWTGGSNPRSCTATMTAAPDTAAPSATTLPTDVFAAGMLIVVDVTFSFRPTIAPSFMKKLKIARSYYLSPRYVPTIAYSAGTTPFATNC